jgi:hypothetical protein
MRQKPGIKWADEETRQLKARIVELEAEVKNAMNNDIIGVGDPVTVHRLVTETERERLEREALERKEEDATK